MNGPDYYLPTAALWAGLGAKLPGLIRNWREPLLRSASAVLFLAGLSFVLGAPPTVAALNRVTGIPNIAAPTTYATITAYSSACLVLILYWRGGTDSVVRRSTRRWTVGYTAVVGAQIALFALGDTPTERRTDFDTYYANTPYIREMIVLYLVAHLVAALACAVLCSKWQRQARGLLGVGLRVLTAGWILNLAFSLTKLAAVTAVWLGRDWSHLSTSVAPALVSAGAGLVAVGYLIPLVGPWTADTLRDLRALRGLRPLWRVVLTAPDNDIHSLRLPWWAPPHLRLTSCESDIRDALSRLSPHLDETVRHAAYTRALEGGATRTRAAHLALAAMVRDAAHRQGHDGPGTRPAPERPAPDLPLFTRDDLVLVADALRALPPAATPHEPLPSRAANP